MRAKRTDLSRGLPLPVTLGSGGYHGRVEVVIDSDDAETFGTNWEGTDPTRFPARIRAAATALFNSACFGKFEISHEDGLLEIRLM